MSLDHALDEAAEVIRKRSLHHIGFDPLLELKLHCSGFLQSSSLTNDVDEKTLTTKLVE
jgi:hypothetical protein